MKPVDSIANADRINYLNIGLLILSCIVAFIIPFELFLFAYAILGPAHYLTEISWLHERKYFTKGKYDFVLLGSLAVVLFLLSYAIKDSVFPDDTPMRYDLMAITIVIAFAGGLLMAFAKNVFHRLLGFLGIVILATFANSKWVLFTVFLPTVIHVFVFTGFFMLFGALKSRSRSGYLSMIVFIICPLLFLFIRPGAYHLHDYTVNSYTYFSTLNLQTMDVFGLIDPEAKSNTELVFRSEWGLIIMRFIAFAYTYHYLNWFSKTSVIGWHRVSKKRLAAIVVLWFVAIGLYAYDYKLGFDYLFCLSFMHVFLEFPLNGISIVGTFTEIKSIMSGKPAAGKMAVSGGQQQRGKKNK